MTLIEGITRITLRGMESNYQGVSGTAYPALAESSAERHSGGTAAHLSPPTASVGLVVPGQAAPQGSKRAVRNPHSGRISLVEQSKRVGPWRERVALAAQQTRHPGFQGAVRVEIEFVLHRPLSTPKRSTPPAVKRPDIDKLGRAVLDAITGVLLRDDSQVTELRMRKRIAEIGQMPETVIWITNLDPK